MFKHQELLHLKHGHHRLQQVLTEKGSELSHTIRRAEKNERDLRKFKLTLQESKKLDLPRTADKKNKKSTLSNEIKNSNTAHKEEIQYKANRNHNNCDMREDSGSDLMDFKQNNNTRKGSKFSEIYVQTIDDGCNSNDDTFENLAGNSHKDPKESEKEDTQQLSDIEVSIAVYASVNKNRKTSNKQ